MKVILLENVAKVGKKFEERKVSDGYGANLLIPRGLAVISTPKAKKRLVEAKAAHEAEEKVKKELLIKSIEDIKKTKITISAKANDKGHLFAGIHKEEIVPALAEQARLNIDPEFITLEHSIKEVGEHDIEIKVDDKTNDSSKIESFQVLKDTKEYYLFEAF